MLSIVSLLGDNAQSSSARVLPRACLPFSTVVRSKDEFRGARPIVQLLRRAGFLPSKPRRPSGIAAGCGKFARSSPMCV